MIQSVYKLLFELIFALAIAILFKFIFFRISDILRVDLIPIALVVLLLWKTNKRIDYWLNSKYSWIDQSLKRLFAQSIAFTLFTSVALILLMFSLHFMRFGDFMWIDRRMRELFFPALFFSFALIAFYVSYNFFKSWKQSLIDIEKYKTLSVEAELKNLKNQINPHFLFNNLSVLTSLVYQNQDKAADFINELSKVYRYVLDNRNVELVTLSEELEFLNHYFYLLKIRFDAAISFSVSISDNKLFDYLPPMCLQLLVENTIQHNEASRENPLRVEIYTSNDYLTIENKIQKRSDKVESTRTGLTNMRARYAYFTNKKVEVYDDGKLFSVVLPLISKR